MKVKALTQIRYTIGKLRRPQRALNTRTQSYQPDLPFLSRHIAFQMAFEKNYGFFKIIFATQVTLPIVKKKDF